MEHITSYKTVEDFNIIFSQCMQRCNVKDNKMCIQLFMKTMEKQFNKSIKTKDDYILSLFHI